MDTFTCAICGGTFAKGWSDEEANAEAQGIFGVDNASKSQEMAVICDDCFNHRPPEEVKEMGKEYQVTKLRPSNP